MASQARHKSGSPHETITSANRGVMGPRGLGFQTRYDDVDKFATFIRWRLAQQPKSSATWNVAQAASGADVFFNLLWSEMGAVVRFRRLAGMSILTAAVAAAAGFSPVLRGKQGSKFSKSSPH